MNAKELVGKSALRTKPMRHNGVEDWSYCGGKPVLIKMATDSHVLIDHNNGPRNWVLDARWLEDWVEFEVKP